MPRIRSFEFGYVDVVDDDGAVIDQLPLAREIMIDTEQNTAPSELYMYVCDEEAARVIPKKFHGEFMRGFQSLSVARGNDAVKITGQPREIAKCAREFLEKRNRSNQLLQRLGLDP